MVSWCSTTPTPPHPPHTVTLLFLFSIAVGTAHGFAVGNYLLNNIVLTHCTLAEDGSASHHLTRMQSIRRSLRNSVRRRSSRSGRRSSTMERQQEPRRQGGAKAKRTGPEPAAGAQGGTLPYINLQAAVTHMMLSETYLAGVVGGAAGRGSSCGWWVLH